MTMSAGFAASLILAVLTLGVSGTDVRCSWGESYWCSDLEVAATCGAIHHCKATVWKNQQLQPDASAVCQFCRSVIGDVEKFVSANSTEAQISDFLSAACKLIPRQSVANQCLSIVKKFTPQIIDLVVSNVNPQVVCSLMRLCTGLGDRVQHADIADHPFSQLDGPNDTPICTDCQNFMRDIRDNIISGEKNVEQQIDVQICSRRGRFKTKCETLVHNGTSALIDFTSKLYNPKVICQRMRFCSKAQAGSYMQSSIQESGDNCEVCKVALSWAQGWLEDPQVQIEVSEFLKSNICSELGEEKEECSVLVGRFGPTVFKFLIKVVSPDIRCRDFGFCTSEPVQTDMPVLADSIVFPVEGSGEKGPGFSPQCMLCNYIVKEFGSILALNATETEILNTVKKVCNVLPKAYAGQCRSFIDSYGPFIISMLKVQFNPDKICAAIGFCTAIARDEQPVATVAKVDDSGSCVMCKTVITYAENLLKDNATVQQIEQVIEKLCSFLPATMKQECDAIVEQYGQLIVNYLLAQFTPEQICTLLKLCPGSKTSLPMTSSLNPLRCIYGPLYWCSNQQTAQLCDAIDHCKKSAWLK